LAIRRRIPRGVYPRAKRRAQRRYGVEFHAPLTRQAGARRFISFHLLVPDAWPVDRAHQLSEEIEERIRSLVPQAITLSHIEPISQPASYDDIKLERWSTRLRSCPKSRRGR